MALGSLVGLENCLYLISPIPLVLSVGMLPVTLVLYQLKILIVMNIRDTGVLTVSLLI